MNQKQLLGLLGALIVLLGIAYLTGVFGGDASTVEVPDVPISAASLEQLRIESPERTLALEREGSRWLFIEPIQTTTDSVAVARFVESLDNLDLQSIVTKNPDRYARYGVDSTAAVVEAEGSDGDHRLVVGNQGPDYQSVYVRLDEDPTVYLTRGSLNLPKDLDTWRDKTVVNIPSASVASVAVAAPEHTYDLRRGPAGWQVETGGTSAPADSAAVARWLHQFAPMRADGFMDDVPGDVVADSATYQVTFSTTSGTTETVRLFNKDDAYAVTGTNGAPTFRLTAYRLNTYFPDPATLKGK